jgi:hypothetical protein
MWYSQNTSFVTHETAIGKTAHIFAASIALTARIPVI